MTLEEWQELKVKKERAKEAAENLVEFVNVFGVDVDTFADEICKAHKTSQQSTMRLLMATIKKLSTVGVDGRNENAVELAKKITEAAGDYSLPVI